MNTDRTSTQPYTGDVYVVQMSSTGAGGGGDRGTEEQELAAHPPPPPSTQQLQPNTQASPLLVRDDDVD